jgi:TATA-box binding protein (TBP) (component of TFIID and TFIIIB)
MIDNTLTNLLSKINKTERCKEDIQIMNFLNTLNSRKDISKIEKPSDLHISTRSAKCKLSHKINIGKMTEKLESIIENNQHPTIVGLEYKDICVGEIKRKKKKIANPTKKQKFYNQATFIIKPYKNGKNINVKFFLNGSISMTGCKNEDDGIIVIKNFIDEAKKYPDVFYNKQDINNINVIDYGITLINTDYVIGFKVDRLKLFKFLSRNYKAYVSYDPSIYQGVKISYMWNKSNFKKDGVCICKKKCRLEKNLRKKNTCKIVTIAIFQNGNIIITGSSYIEQTMEAYNYINKILYESYKEIVRFSILDCDFE